MGLRTEPIEWHDGTVYEAYVPDPMEGWRPQLSDAAKAKCSAAASDLAHAVQYVAGSGVRLDPGGFILGAEALGSSWIEGIRPAPRDMFRSLSEIAVGRAALHSLAAEAAAVVTASVAARGTVSAGVPLLESVRAAHEILMAPGTLSQYGGQIRDVQCWIGGSRTSPRGAVHVPPVPSRCAELLADLGAWVSESGLNAVATAAIAHAQFETIHPYVDGNGRAGRILIDLMLRSVLPAGSPTPPVSLAMSRNTHEYYSALNAFRSYGASSAERSEAAETMILDLCSSIGEASWALVSYCGLAKQMLEAWEGALEGADPLVLDIAKMLPSYPCLAPHDVARLTGASDKRARSALRVLASADVVRAVRGRSGRVSYDCEPFLRAYGVMVSQMGRHSTCIADPFRRIIDNPFSRPD